MLIYAIGVLLLIQSLCISDKWLQLWNADDACTSAGGSSSALLEWFSLLCSQNLLLVMFSKPSKCFVVMSASQLDKARHVSGGSRSPGCYWS